MTSPSLNLETKINTLKAVLTSEEPQRAVDVALRAANGDISTALASLEQLPQKVIIDDYETSQLSP